MSLAWLDQVWREALAPEPTLTVSAWADRHRILPPTSAEPGPWRTSRVPYLREVMNALSTGSRWERVVFQKAAQIGATECGLNWLGYVIAHAPGLCLLVQPSLDMARRNTRVRLDPLIESTPALKERISAPRSRDAHNSAFTKSFPGGQLICTGANSSAALRSTPARYLFLDEVDAYPSDVGGEGDPIALAIARTTTYRGRRKIFLTSTPTISGVSRIEAAFKEGDQRYYHVPCRHCEDMAPITWARIKWPPEKPAEAYMICEKCGGLHFEYDKPWLLEHGKWVSSAQGDGRTCSFHLSALYSPFQTWAEIALEFHASRGDPARLQAWQNLCLGEVYEDLSAQPPELNWLASRVEDWDAAPTGVLVVTAGVDLQDDRAEVELVGWGLNDESWSLAYEVVYGDPAGAQLWQELDELIRQKIPHVLGKQLPIKAVAIDSGGHHTQAAYAFCRDKGHRSIWACKGASRPGMPPWPRKPIRTGKSRSTPVYLIGTEALKDALLARLKIETPGPGYCHFPVGRGLNYFTGLTSERPIRKYHRGVARRVWVLQPGVRNEPLDARILSMAALEGLKASGLRLTPLSGQPKPRRRSMAEWSAVFNG